jgi:multiple sugar transport system substrate-binding protein
MMIASGGVVAGVASEQVGTAADIQSLGAPAAIPASLQEGGSFRYLYNATPGPNELVYNTLMDMFEESHPDVTIERIRVPGEIEIVQQMLAMLAAGDPPEVFLNRQRTATPFISRDVLTDIVPLAKEDGVDLKDFWPSAIETYGRGEALYGLPFGASSSAFYFNIEQYEEAGVTLPTDLEDGVEWNWDTLREQVLSITRGDGPGRQFGLDAIFELDHVNLWIWQNGGDLWDLETGTCLLNEPEAVEAMNWLVSLVQENQAMPTPEQVASAGDLFAAGRVGIKAGGRFVLDAIKESEFALNDKVGMVVTPTGPVAGTTRGDDLAHSIPAGSERADLGWEFAKLWTSDEGQQQVITTRRSYTSRQSFARSDWMIENLLPWEDGEAYFNGLERTGVYKAPDRANEVEAIFDREIGLAFIGEKSVEEAADAMTRDIQVVLQTPI